MRLLFPDTTVSVLLIIALIRRLNNHWIGFVAHNSLHNNKCSLHNLAVHHTNGSQMQSELLAAAVRAAEVYPFKSTVTGGGGGRKQIDVSASGDRLELASFPSPTSYSTTTSILTPGI